MTDVNDSPRPCDPIHPGRDALGAGLGAGAWGDRPDRPDLTVEGELRFVPLRQAEGFSLVEQDPDPRGLPVVGADGVQAGTVSDVWVDRAEPALAYLEVELDDSGDRVLLPEGFARRDRKRNRLTVKAIMGGQFDGVPRTAAPDRVTLQEEDRIRAYYAGGYRYADWRRSESLL